MSNLIPPHGKEGKLKPLLLEGDALKAAKEKAKGLKEVKMTTRETSDLIMLGIGAFTPLEGFMGKADWKGVCENYYDDRRDFLAHSDYLVRRRRPWPMESRKVKRSP